MILDTMVISELTCLEASPKVVVLVDKFDHEDLYTTTVTKAEIVFGLAAMPAGKRRFELEKNYRDLFLDVATRDTTGFDHEGLTVINPWQQS